MRRLHPATRVLAALLAAQLALPAGMLHAAGGTKIGHNSPKSYIPGFRINLETKIEDPEGVLLARCYFRSRKDQTFVFTDLAAAEKTWKTTLPAPWLGSEEIEYLFVVVNRSKKVFRSESFRIPEKKTPQLKKWKEVGEVREVRLDRLQEFAELYLLLRNELQSSWKKKLPDWQEPISDVALDISTEQAAATAGLGGFWDTVVVSEVPPHLAYGQLVGLYPVSQAAAKGAVAATTSATATTGATGLTGATATTAPTGAAGAAGAAGATGATATTGATGATGVGSAGTIGGGSSWIWYTLGAVAVLGGVAATALVVGGGDSENDRIGVNMVINFMGRTDYTCRADLTYSVQTEDSSGRVMQVTSVRAYQVFKVNVIPGNFSVNWKYNEGGNWFGWRVKSTNATQPIELPCIGYGTSGSGGTRIW